MNRLIVDNEKCTGCGKCEERCGYKKVISVGETGKAVFKPDRGECIECLHCLMICPNDAIRVDGSDGVTVSRVNADTSSVLTRHSCRVYKKKDIQKEVLDGLLQDTNLAPGHTLDFRKENISSRLAKKLTELRAFLLGKIERHARLFRTLCKLPFIPKPAKDNLRKLAWCFTVSTEANKGKEQLFQGAPAVVMITGPASIALSKVNSDYALMQLMILAEERGLGTCISGYIDGYSKDIGRFLGLPKNDRVFCGAMIGYPADTFPKYVTRRDSVIEWL